MNFHFRFLIQLVILFFCFHLYAEVPVVTYSPADYDAGMQNWSVDVQHNGWIYVANNYGLLEYDGDHWQLYGIWNGTVIRSVSIAESGDIYVGATNEFGRFRPNDHGGLSYDNMSLSVPAGKQFFGEVWNINFFNDLVCFQTNNDLFLFNIQSDSLVNHIHRTEHVYCSASINGGLYVATSQGVYSLIGSNMNLLQGSDILRGFEVRAMCAINTSSFLIATDLGGLFIYDGKQITGYRTAIDSYLRKNQVYTMVVSDKYIALGTVLGGIVLIDFQGDNVRYFSSDEGLQNNTILSLKFDANGYLWAGLDNGLSHVFVDYPLVNLFSNKSIGAGYSYMNYKGIVYYGTNQGVYYTQSVAMPNLLNGSQGQVWSLDTIGNTLFCSHHRGLFMIKNNTFVPVITTTGFWNIRSLTDNYLVAGAYDGLYVFRHLHGAVQCMGKIADFDETALNYQIDKNGKIWFNGQNGIYTIAVNCELLEAKIDTLIRKTDSDDNFYITTYGNQIVISNPTRCYLVGEDGCLTQTDSLFSDLAGLGLYYKIMEDENSDLWFITPHELHVRRAGHSEVDEVINNPHLFIDGFYYLTQIDDATLLLGGVDGFYTLNKNLLKFFHEQNTETLYIRRMLSTNNGDSVVYGESFRPMSKKIVLPYKNNSVRFLFGSSVDNICEYSVRLEPSEDDFSVWNTLNIKEYTSLREGDYTLRVKMRYQGVESIEKTLSFTILPPWYRAWYAYIMYIILLGLLIYMLIYFFYTRVQMREAKLKYETERELKEQEKKYQHDAFEQEKRILELENERANSELRHKSQEMSNLLLNQVSRQEILQDIQADLYKISDALSNNEAKHAKQKVKNLLEKISKLTSSDIDWKKFEENFDIVNDRFLEKLTAKYPTLNKNERKLCVYIRMGLYTKEIAPLMNMSVRGIEMLRYRMRRKMNLEREENLEQMLLAI